MTKGRSGRAQECNRRHGEKMRLPYTEAAEANDIKPQHCDFGIWTTKFRKIMRKFVVQVPHSQFGCLASLASEAPV